MSNANDSVHPYPANEYRDAEYGLTKREYFAAMAMQGLLSNAQGPIQANGMNGWGLVNCTLEQVAGTAVRSADALLAELAKVQS